MSFNRHFRLEGKHAFLSASKGTWVNYDDDKLIDTYHNLRLAQIGTELHDIASNLIKHKISLPRSRRTLNSYVNDAIGFRMTPEQPLYYSDNCFGTADAISFDGGVLRIHDLKTGKIPAKMRQLEIYAAMFCLEYDQKPGELDIQLRIYQNDDVVEHVPDLNDLVHIMGQIIRFDQIIEDRKAEELL